MRITLYRDYKEEGWESMQVYADHLAASLRKINKRLQIDEFVAFPRLSRRIAQNSKLLRYVFRFAVNPLFANRHQGDVNHIIDQANAHLLAVLDPQKTIVTCHDLIVPYWIMQNVRPQTYKKRIKRIGELWRINFLRKAAKIIAVSQATKDELVGTLGIHPGKIVVIPEGVDKSFRPPEAVALRAIRSRYALPEKYVLNVGTTHEYKNMEGLIKAVSLLRRQDASIRMVKVGSPWTNDQRLLISRLSLDPYITHLGFVPKQDLSGIYAGALCLIHPSHTEGFGFTVLEAMATGCPVVVSAIPALQEMVGSSGIYIDPEITAPDIKKIGILLKSSQKRAALRSRGLIRSAAYSWMRTSMLTYGVYRDVCMAGNGRT